MENKEEKLEWQQGEEPPLHKGLRVIFGNLLLLIDEERKKAEKQLEDAQKLLEKLGRKK